MNDSTTVTNDTASTPTTFAWGLLTTELKLNVLRFRLIFNKPIAHLTHHVHNHNTLLPLALTDKELSALAMEMYYTQNEFIAEMTRNLHHPRGFAYSFKFPSPAVGHWIRKLTLKLNMNHYNDGHFGGKEDDRGQLLRAGAVWWTRSPSRWQDHLRPKELKVILVMSTEKCLANWNVRSWVWDMLEGSRYEFDVPAEKLVVEVRGMPCPAGGPADGPCDGECARTIEKRVWAVLTKG